MKTSLSILLIVIVSVNSYSQESSSTFTTIIVNKKLSELVDRVDLTTPLKAFVTFNYAFINGKIQILREACSASRRSEIPDSASDLRVSERIRELYLNARITEIIVYRDSIAYVISKRTSISESYYSIRKFYFELGKWVNVSEDLRDNIASGRIYTKTHAEMDYDDLQNVYNKFLKLSN